jgi:hypothetical protein
MAWQPFTFGGVAAFARASWGRLFLAQVAVAALCAASVVWFLGRCYSPVITQAIQKLPASACITNGGLAGIPDDQVSETKFLSISVTASQDPQLDHSADVQIALLLPYVQVSSLLSSALGSLEFDYNRSSTLDLSRSHLEPLWGAWQPIVLAGAGIAVVLLLLPIWALLAVIYAPAAKFVAWFCDRQLSWPGAWRLASAALLPGALLLALGVLLYGRQTVDVFGLGFFQTVHFLVGWVYVLAAPVFAPRLSPAPTNRNPFSS